jgi:hypothetical protein
MWFIPLVLIGFAVVALAKGGGRGDYGPAVGRETPRRLPPPPVTTLPGQAMPTPLQVLNQYASAQQIPPPQVILCAIAEAEMMGRTDISHEIVRVYIAPVVYQRDIALAKSAAPPAPPPMEVPPPPAMQQHTPPPQAAPAMSDDAIQAMLDANPHAFIQAAMHAPPVLEVEAQEPDTDQAGADQTMDPPIDGIPAEVWEGFCNRLEREAPTFQSSRHIGRYRQRRERLAELGIDPSGVAGSPEAQRAALDAELADIHRHVVESGDTSRWIGQHVLVPGIGDPVAVTLSGVMGIAQAAGLEGAASWLEHPRDRRKFPHTTEAFLHTNGMF